MAQTVLISGTSSGLGRHAARLFAERGWNVMATMRRANHADEMLSGRPNLLVHHLDVTIPATIERAVSAAVARFGRLDAVVNNAGYGQFGLFEAISDAQVRENFETNLFGVMNVMRVVVPMFRSQGGGQILNVSSAGGLIGLPTSSIYLATKFALEGFSESVWHELASQNIRLKSVEPGGMETDFFSRSGAERPAGETPPSYAPFVETANAALRRISARRSQPEEIAEVVYEALNDGQDRLRYFAAPGVRDLVEARRTLDDQAYERFIRAQFA